MHCPALHGKLGTSKVIVAAALIHFLLQVEAYCIANLIQSVMDSNDEFLVLDVHFAATNGGLQCAFELLHQVLQAPRWVGSSVAPGPCVCIAAPRKASLCTAKRRYLSCT